ncbi:hypothetical protein FAES_1404 [Fibrella aestuarina BUZ 2]|uniref:RNA polymerase, sigma-24 subunit, ECF subfamily n=1 Tax=Fibrella aestuarina BUZ 2 TaxID=1166018 RepID=I0K5L1_9BACT|nr:hypothetical protein [Fibrella aestuarina]CCG99414.1 hypothetical protein FAES_1404 [Fibrella aestuarina BUZ 2]
MTLKTLLGGRQPLTDADIVAGLRGTERAQNKAIEALYEQNQAFLTRFLRSKQNGLYFVKEPEDIIWEAITAVLHNVLDGHYVPSSQTPLRAYLVSICRNLWYKAVSQEENRDRREEAFWQAMEPSELPDVEQWLHNQQQWTRYLLLFDRAGKHCRQILTLWLVDGLDNGAITEVMVREGKLKNEQVIRNTKSDCLKKLTSLLR